MTRRPGSFDPMPVLRAMVAGLSLVAAAGYVLRLAGAL